MTKTNEIYIVSENVGWADAMKGWLSRIFNDSAFYHVKTIDELWDLSDIAIVIYDKETLGNPCLKLVSPGARGGEWLIVNGERDDIEACPGLIALGFSGLIVSESTIEMLPKAIRTIIDGELWFSREALSLSLRQIIRVGKHSLSSVNILAVKYKLTQREQQIFLSLLQGLTNKEIALKMCVSPSTIKCHVSNILLKTGKHSRSQLSSLLVDNVSEYSVS
jgi:DNA-binding NarL/FixJ family response regulator